MSDTQSGAFSPTDASRSDRSIPRPNVRAGRDADETDDEDPSAAYCEGCERHLPHGTPPVGRVVAVEGTIPACARPDCEGYSRGIAFASHTAAALAARRRSGGGRR